MPILSRRSTQRIINELLKHIDPKSLTEIVSNINKENTQSLDYIWEVIVLNLLSTIGSIEYEYDHGGKRKPDVYFRSHKLEMVADITCVSDSDQNKNNDINHFTNELNLVSKKYGINDLNGFFIRVEDDPASPKKKRLKLPSRGEARDFIKSRLTPFLIEVSKNKNQKRTIEISENKIEIFIEYNPESIYLTSSYPTFTIANTIKNNPIYNRLKDKRDQLKDSGFNGLKGVVICDGGCDLITSAMSNSQSFSAASIINRFLDSQETVSFVILVYVKENFNGYFSHIQNRRFEIKYLAKRSCEKDVEWIVNSLNTNIRKFPIPERNGLNASLLLQKNKALPGKDFYGGFTRSGSKVTISSRAFLNLFNGTVNVNQFINDHKEAGQVLKTRISDGYKLKSISLIKKPDSDDDWVEIEFDEEYDPAVKKYELKSRNN